MCVRHPGHGELARATDPYRVFPAALLCPRSLGPVPLCAPRPVAGGMEVRRVAREAWRQGGWLVVCLLLDTVYLARVYRAAPLPAGVQDDNDNDTLLINITHAAPRSAPLSLASHPAAPLQAALLPSSSSSSSSSLLSSLSSSSMVVSEKRSDNVSFSETDLSQAEAGSRDNTSGGGDSDPGSVHHRRGNNGQAVPSPHAGKARKEFPLALVVASATAAVSILLIFCLSYVWHTRQLDRRAQKLAIRLAAQADADLKCSQCRPRARPRYGPPDSGSDSGGEDCRVLPAVVGTRDDVNSLNEEDEEEVEAEDGSRRKPGGVGRTLGTRRGSRGRGGARRSGSRSSRKWSGHSGGATRSSLVTDQEILSHFASRRHSTFFI